MNRTLKIYLIVLVSIIALLTLMQVNKKPILDWRKTYMVDDKKPFGLYVFDKEADELFNNKIKQVEQSPFDYFLKDSTKSLKNYLIIEEYFDKVSIEKIVDEVEKGSNLFILKEWGEAELTRLLGLDVGKMYKNEPVKLFFTDSKRKATAHIDKLPTETHFLRIKDEDFEFLGLIDESGGTEYGNFIKIKHGKGYFYIHLEPLVLTNYYLLKEDHYNYVEQMFSYLPNEYETVWFVNPPHKSISYSPMRFILDNDMLRYAWQILLLSLALYLIFRGKRNQRIVPIVEPLENMSAEFVRNIGNLYLNEGDVNDMMQKKATYFLNKVRSDLLLDTSRLNRDFIEKLHHKTNADIEKIERAVELINISFSQANLAREEDLFELNQLLDDIYK